MGVNLHQKDDGSLAFVDDLTGIEINRLGGPTSGVAVSGSISGAPRYALVESLKFPITGGNDTGGGILSWLNGTGQDLIVERLLLDVKASSTAACTMVAGVTATSTGVSNNLIDGLSAVAAGLFDNITDKGTAGKARQILPNGQYLTVSVSSGASAGLSGSAYLDSLNR